MILRPIMYAMFGFLSCLFVPAAGDGNMTPNFTITPSNEFIERPNNKTVLEGYSTIFRCKAKATVHNCQWFYLRSGLNWLDSRNSPTLVKEFRPLKNNECSIRFKKIRMMQSGQWICRGLQIHARKYIVSPPAHLKVIPALVNPSTPQNPIEDESDLSSDISHSTDEGQTVNAKLGAPATLECRIKDRLEYCSWIKPDGTSVHFSEGDASSNYIQQENCSLKIIKASTKDEGKWSCIVSTSLIYRVGHVVQVHLKLESQSDGLDYSTGGKQNGSSIDTSRRAQETVHFSDNKDSVSTSTHDDPLHEEPPKNTRVYSVSTSAHGDSHELPPNNPLRRASVSNSTHEDSYEDPPFRKEAKATQCVISRPLERKEEDIPSICTLHQALATLQTISKTAALNDDEFDRFGKSIASQLKLLPLNRALPIQLEIQTILTRERIESLNQDTPSQRQETVHFSDDEDLVSTSAHDDSFHEEPPKNTFKGTRGY